MDEKRDMKPNSHSNDIVMVEDDGDQEVEMGKSSDPIKSTIYKNAMERAKEQAMKETNENTTLYNELADQKKALDQEYLGIKEDIRLKETDLKMKINSKNRLKMKVMITEKTVNEYKYEIQKLVEKLKKEETDLCMNTAILSRYQEHIVTDGNNIQLKHQELEGHKQKTEALEKRMNDLVVGQSAEKTAVKARLEKLEEDITEKTTELECPVCFNTCLPPIYSCTAQHLVCSSCRPKLTICGECREKYRGLVRHRYAERDYATMQTLKEEKDKLLLSLEPEMQVFVKVFSVPGICPKTITIEIKPVHTIRYMKARIEDKIKIPSKLQRLALGGKQLENDHTLRYYNVGKEMTFDLFNIRGL